MRAGTENVYGIIGFGKALELAMQHYNARQLTHIKGTVKTHMKNKLSARVPRY